MNNLIAIVGRPNVGKSTLFNRLTETKDAIIDPTSGTTRDRKYGRAEWTGRAFTVIDTGGWITNSDDTFEAAIRAQVQISIEEAALILFMVDGQTGPTDLDSDIARMLRQTNKPVIVACNKIDTAAHDLVTSEFYRLGLDSERGGYGTTITESGSTYGIGGGGGGGSFFSLSRIFSRRSLLISGPMRTLKTFLPLDSCSITWVV